MRIKITGAVFRKELTDIVRDRRALVISVLIPLLLFPAAFSAMNLNLKKTASSLDSGIPVYINITDEGIRGSLLAGARIIPVESDDPAADLNSGRIAAVIEYVPAGQPGQNGISITYDNTSQYSAAACDIIYSLASSCAAGGTQNRENEVKITRKPAADEHAGAGTLMLQMLIPMLIFIFSAAAPMAVSADLFAGERERDTLEHLLSLPVTPAELTAGKYMAALCAGVTGAASFMAGIAVSFLVSPGVFGADNISISISPAACAWTLLFAVLIIMTFTAAEFVISIFSGSAKEAQIIFIPLVITAMACGHSVTMIDVKRIPLLFRHIPMVNSGLIIKEFMAGIYSPPFMAVAAAWCVLVTVMFLLLAAWMLGREKFIFRG